MIGGSDIFFAAHRYWHRVSQLFIWEMVGWAPTTLSTCAAKVLALRNILVTMKTIFPLWYGNSKPTNITNYHRIVHLHRQEMVGSWKFGSLALQPFIAWLGSGDPKNCSIKAWSRQPNTTVGFFFVFRWILFVGSENLAKPVHEKSHEN